MKAHFLHVGLTVDNLQKSKNFYMKYFDFKLMDEGIFDENFVSSHNELYNLTEDAYIEYTHLINADGMVVELFKFHPQIDRQEIQWNVPGYQHICFRVEDIFSIYNQMAADGIKVFFYPDSRGKESEHWMFVKDPDGNLVEIWD